MPDGQGATVTAAADSGIDSLLPAAMAAKAELTGVKRANIDTPSLFALAVLAGAFIAFGAVFFTTTIAGAGVLPYGVLRLIGGVAFALGVVLIVCGGGALFTGDNLIVMAWASGKVSTASMLRTWIVVYAGNFIGAAATAAIVYLSGQYTLGDGAVGATALGIASGKLGFTFSQALWLGILCNTLICLAVWLTFSTRTSGGKVLVTLLPVSAFVAAGFEHCVANMYFLPHALLIKWGAGDAFWQAIGKAPADYPMLRWDVFLTANLVPVTLGNLIGGSVLVGAVYWFVYLRRGAKAVAPSAAPPER
jgi:formate transporter